MKIKLLSTLFFFTLTGFISAQDSLVIVSEGKCHYSIWIENTEALNAAEILQNYVDSISGQKINIANKTKSVGKNIEFRNIAENDKNIIKPDGFRFATSGTDLKIIATNANGYCNAVYYLLEHGPGCRFYAPAAKLIPRKSVLKIPAENKIINPVFDFRINYNGSAFDKDFACWHGLHNKPQRNDSPHFEISDNWGMWVHTMHKLLPPEKYFKTHPEYFALRNGVRIPDQVCLSNPEVIQLVTKALRQEMKKQPHAKYWSVSQMDNFNYCQCDACRTIDEENGSPAGSMITFVNTIAAQFPDKVISTLAYQYTRKAPTKVKPLPNVNIMLCSIECDRNKPIAADTCSGGFAHDLAEWSHISKNILVWDYVINFSNIIGPFPNFHVLKPNLELFRDAGVSMLFEQGWPHQAGENTELRSYLLAKLMWDPSANTDSLILDFCTGFYGPGGIYVYHYITQSTSALVKSGKALTLYEPMSAHSAGFLSPVNLEIYFSMLDSASQTAAGIEPYAHRIDMAMQPLRYAWLEVAKSLPFTDAWLFEKDGQSYRVKTKSQLILNELSEKAKKYGPRLFHETSISPQEYYDWMNTYFIEGVQLHKGVGKSISFETPYSPKYDGGSKQALIDGVLGTGNYFCLWQGWNGADMIATIDLGHIDSVREVEIHYLRNQQSWIFEPAALNVSISTDGIQFKEMGGIENPTASEKKYNKIGHMGLGFGEAHACRYVKVKLNNIGKLPAWRGIDGKAWLFVDEIIIK